MLNQLATLDWADWRYPLLIGLLIAACSYIIVTAYNRAVPVPEETYSPIQDSQVLIDTFMRGAISERVFRANAAYLEFPAPMVEDVVAQYKGRNNPDPYEGEPEQ